MLKSIRSGAGLICQRKTLLCLALVFLFHFPGCQRDKSTEHPDRIRIGALFPLTGHLRDKGVDSINGVKMAVEEINAAGGISALGGAELEIVIADSQGNPQTGKLEARRLIEQESVIAIIGTYQSSVTLPATQVAERLETPFIVSISAANIITERGFNYTFRIQPKANFYARDQIQFIKDLAKTANYSVKRVALIHENTDFGTSVALAQKSFLTRNGFEVVADVSYRAEDVKHLDSETAEILAAEPDLILTVTYLMDSIIIRRAIMTSGMNIPMLDMAGGTVSPEYIKILGDMANGTLTMAEYSKYSIGGKNLNDRFHSRYGVDITGDSAHAYQAVLVLQDALERSLSTNKKVLRNSLAATDLRHGKKMILPAERLRFDKNGQNEFARLYVVQIRNGELLPVWPTQYATAKVEIGK